MKEFTDVQLELFDTMTDLEMRKRDYPLDEHPQEMYTKHHIIKMVSITGREFYLWNPSSEEMTWTEDKSGAYRYSDTGFGHQSREHDFKAARDMKIARGFIGAVEVETING